MMQVEEFNVDINGTSRDDMGREYTVVTLDKFDADENPLGHKCFYLLGDFHEELKNIEFLCRLWEEPQYAKIGKITALYKIY